MRRIPSATNPRTIRSPLLWPNIPCRLEGWMNSSKKAKTVEKTDATISEPSTMTRIGKMVPMTSLDTSLQADLKMLKPSQEF